MGCEMARVNTSRQIVNFFFSNFKPLFHNNIYYEVARGADSTRLREIDKNIGPSILT